MALRSIEGGVLIHNSKDEKKAEQKKDDASGSADVDPTLHSLKNS